MAIPGLGPQTLIQFNQGSANKTAESNAINKNNNVVSTGTSQPADTKTALFTAIPSTANTSQTETSRRDLAEVETARNRFQLQTESEKKSTSASKSLQTFIDVAEFEAKDEFQGLYGLDIFI